MPRPTKCRKVCAMPQTLRFIPDNYAKQHPPVALTVDEYETIRLIDKENLSQEECGERMEVARTTVQQIYTQARKKIATALVDGLPLKIEGGRYRLCDGNCGCIGCPIRERNTHPQRKAGDKIMKIAIPTDENRKDVCPSFARAYYFLFVNEEDKSSTLVENPAKDEEGGAGPKAAQFLVDNRVDALITPRLGENAAEVLQEAEIDIYKSAETESEKNIVLFREQKLEKLTTFHQGYHGIR